MAAPFRGHSQEVERALAVALMCSEQPLLFHHVCMHLEAKRDAVLRQFSFLLPVGRAGRPADLRSGRLKSMKMLVLYSVFPDLLSPAVLASILEETPRGHFHTKLCLLALGKTDLYGIDEGLVRGFVARFCGSFGKDGENDYLFLKLLVGMAKRCLCTSLVVETVSTLLEKKALSLACETQVIVLAGLLPVQYRARKELLDRGNATMYIRAMEALSFVGASCDIEKFKSIIPEIEEFPQMFQAFVSRTPVLPRRGGVFVDKVIQASCLFLGERDDVDAPSTKRAREEGGPRRRLLEGIERCLESTSERSDILDRIKLLLDCFEVHSR
jgi:hypothetical protein